MKEETKKFYLSYTFPSKKASDDFIKEMELEEYKLTKVKPKTLYTVQFGDNAAVKAKMKKGKPKYDKEGLSKNGKTRIENNMAAIEGAQKGLNRSMNNEKLVSVYTKNKFKDE